MAKKTIAIISNTFGGLYNFRKEVIESVVDSGFSVCICCPAGKQFKMDYFTGIGCELEVSPIDRRGINPFHDIVLFFKYFRLLRKLKPLAVLTYTIKPNVYGGIAARLLGIPQLANITGLGTSIQDGGWLKRLTVSLYRFGLKKARVLFYQNSAIRDFCIDNKIGKQGILLPGSGVNLDSFSFHEYPAVDQSVKFFMIGRIMKDKGVDEFFQTVTSIHDRYPDVEFHILGGCEEQYEDRIKELQNSGSLIWHGSVPDTRPYLNEAWCVIHPSYHEGMSNVLQECCASGRPAIACDINGCKEIIQDGVNGFLCEVRDAESLCLAVERFINLPYDQKVTMGKEARRVVEEGFDRSIISRAYLEELKKIGY